MQSQLAYGRRDLCREFTNTLLVRCMRQRDEGCTLRTRHDVTCTPQAPTYRLANAPQARIGCMPAKDLDVGIKVIECKRDDRQPALLTGCNRPVVFKDFPKSAVIQ